MAAMMMVSWFCSMYCRHEVSFTRERSIFQDTRSRGICAAFSCCVMSFCRFGFAEFVLQCLRGWCGFVWD